MSRTALHPAIESFRRHGIGNSGLWMLEQCGLDIGLVALGNSLKLSLLFLLIGERSFGTERSLGRGDRCSETWEFIPIL
jgi:hypothetical protein